MGPNDLEMWVPPRETPLSYRTILVSPVCVAAKSPGVLPFPQLPAVLHSDALYIPDSEAAPRRTEDVWFEHSSAGNGKRHPKLTGGCVRLFSSEQQSRSKKPFSENFEC